MEQKTIDLRTGNTFHYQRYKYHIVAAFYDGENMYVVKYFGKYKQWWHYEVYSESALKCKIEFGLIRK